MRLSWDDIENLAGWEPFEVEKNLAAGD
jgi:hypothetical protein